MSSAPTYPVAPMIPTRIRRGPPSALTPRCDLDWNPDERSVTVAAGDPSPALTGARGRSRAAGSGCSQRPDGPSSWAHDYTTVCIVMLQPVGSALAAGPVGGGTWGARVYAGAGDA